MQEEKCVHVIEHDEHYKCGEKINQDNDNISERCYNQEKHKEKRENLVYEYYMDEEMESRDTQKCEENYSKKFTWKDFRKVFCNWEQELTYD